MLLGTYIRRQQKHIENNHVCLNILGVTRGLALSVEQSVKGMLPMRRA